MTSLSSRPYKQVFCVSWHLSLEHFYYLYHFSQEGRYTFLHGLQIISMTETYKMLILQNRRKVTNTFNEGSGMRNKNVVQTDEKRPKLPGRIRNRESPIMKNT
jgi:hypothetical protein